MNSVNVTEPAGQLRERITTLAVINTRQSMQQLFSATYSRFLSDLRNTMNTANSFNGISVYFLTLYQMHKLCSVEMEGSYE